MNNTKKFKIALLIVMSIIVILVIVFRENIYNVISNDSVYTLDTLKSENYNSMERVVYDIYNDNIVKCSKDGTKLQSIDDKIIWDQPYTMNRPMLYKSYPYLVVADLKGNMAYVFNNKGVVYSVKSKYPILMCKINTLGQLVIVEQNDQEHFIRIYNNKGDLIIARNTTVEKDGFPIDIDLSPDGQKFITSYVDTNGTELVSKLTFFDFGYNGDYYIDKIVGSSHLKNSLVADVKFVNNSNVIVAGDNIIQCFKFNDVPKEMWKKEITNKITSIAINQNDYFSIGYGELLPGKNSELFNSVMVYHVNGNELSKVKFDKEITYLDNYNNYIIVGCNRNFFAVNKNGKILWSYNSTKDVKKIIPFKNNKNFLAISKNTIDFLKLGKIY